MEIANMGNRYFPNVFFVDYFKSANFCHIVGFIDKLNKTFLPLLSLRFYQFPWETKQPCYLARLQF